MLVLLLVVNLPIVVHASIIAVKYSPSPWFSILVGPNPILEDINIEIRNYGVDFIGNRGVEIKMYNTIGNIVLEETFLISTLTAEHFYTVSTRNIPSGIYTIRIQVGGTSRKAVVFYKIGGNVWGYFGD